VRSFKAERSFKAARSFAAERSAETAPPEPARPRLRGLFGTGAPRLRRAIAAGFAVLAAGGLATGVTQLAGAAPKPTVAQQTAKVNALQAKFDQAVQQYDQVNQKLTAAKARLAQVNKEMTAAQARYQTTRKRVVQIAAATYMDSGQTSLAGLLTTSDPGAVLGQASILTQLTGARNAETKTFLTAAQQLVSVQQAQAHTEAGIQQLATQRAQSRDAIKKNLDQQKAILDTLTAAQRKAVQSATVGGNSSSPTVTTTKSSPSSTYTGPTGTQAQKAVAFAYAQIGCWYRWGGTGPCSKGFDCSGLVQAAWASAGVSIPRTTTEQWAALPHVSMSAIQPGDLIYFNGIGHVAMYVGNGYMIDAPQTGEQIRKLPTSTSWYANSVDGVARP
jgi:peptidoglycan DL-endopeptidase CwlO